MALVLGWNRNLEKWEYPKGFNEITDKNHNRIHQAFNMNNESVSYVRRWSLHFYFNNKLLNQLESA